MASGDLKLVGAVPSREAEAAVPRPYALLAEITYRCPLHCPYCSNPLHPVRYGRELDTPTWKRVLQEARALGVAQVQFSGGEPLARLDLEELVAETDRLGLYPFVITGGTLATPARLVRLQAAGLRALQISVQDARPDRNDGIAGVRSFEAKRLAAEAARTLGMHVTLNVVLHRHNLDALESIIALASAWGVDALELAHTQYVGWAFHNRRALMPTRDQVQAALATVARARARHGTPSILHVLPDWFQEVPKPCVHGWGRVHLVVAPDGAMLPCAAARELPGFEYPNVREQSLERAWFESDAFQRFRGTAWMPSPCRDCPRREIDFGGCRCQAALLTGDAAATDPVCSLSPDHGRLRSMLSEATESTMAPEPRSYAGPGGRSYVGASPLTSSSVTGPPRSSAAK